MQNIQDKVKKIIVCKGTCYVPERFWEWAVGTEEEFTEEMKAQGWIKSECKEYLSIEQLNYLSKEEIQQ